MIVHRALVAAAAAGVVAAGVAGIATAATREPVRVVSQARYELTGDLATMVAFPTNAIAVRGRVVGLDAARWNTPDGTAPTVRGNHHYVFTPVRVEATEILGGTALVAGQTFTTRRYDGRVGDVRYVAEHGRSPLRAGADVVLFLQAPHPLNDGRADLVANVVYQVVDGSLVTGEGEVKGTIGELTALLAASPRW